MKTGFKTFITESDFKAYDSLAKKLVELHNAACKEYKVAFASVGAKMWHDDKAHLLKPNNQAAIARNMRPYKDNKKKIEGLFHIVRPLTVLDSYPDVSHANRRKLEKQVDTIHDKYQKEWKAFLKGFTL